MKLIREHRKASARVPTHLQLPIEIRQLLEAAIDHVTIHSLVDSVSDAARRRAESKTPQSEEPRP
jgi:hypothetical protein